MVSWKRDSIVSPMPRQELVCRQMLTAGHAGRAEIHDMGFQMPGERCRIGTNL